MKKLLLLCIPLMFFFGCEEESEDTMYNCTVNGCIESESGEYATLEDCNNICNCDCGEVVEIVNIPAFNGYLVDDGMGGFIVVGAHDAYTLFNVQNYCSGNIGTACGNLTLGQSYCMDYQCQFQDCVMFDPATGALVVTSMLTDCISCDCEPIPFE